MVIKSNTKPVATLIGLLFFFMAAANAQGQKYAFIEAGGGGLLVSANMDMRFKKETREGFGARIGVTNTGFFGDDTWITAVPVSVNYLLGKKRSALLLGANATFAIIPKNAEVWDYRNAVFGPEVGYRFRPMARGIAFHVSWSPLFNTVDGAMPAWFGIGVGYAWK